MCMRNSCLSIVVLLIMTSIVAADINIDDGLEHDYDNLNRVYDSVIVDENNLSGPYTTINLYPGALIDGYLDVYSSPPCCFER